MKLRKMIENASTLEEQQELIKDAKQLDDILSKCKTWYRKQQKTRFCCKSLLDRTATDYNNGQQDTYGYLFNIIQYSNQFVPPKLFKEIYTGYVLSILSAIDNYSFMEYQTDPGPDMADNGDRVAKLPYEIPKKFEEFADSFI